MQVSSCHCSYHNRQDDLHSTLISLFFLLVFTYLTDLTRHFQTETLYQSTLPNAGTDVFGRGTFGGGGMQSNVGIEAAHRQGNSPCTAPL